MRRANDVVQGPAGRELDVVAIEAWLLESLRDAPQRERIAVIVPDCARRRRRAGRSRGRGAGGARLRRSVLRRGERGVRAAARQLFADVFAQPAAGLNLGRQLFYLQTRRAGTVSARRASAAVSAVLVVAPVGRHGGGGHLARHAHRSVAPARTDLFVAGAQAGLGAHDAAATFRQRPARPHQAERGRGDGPRCETCEVACGIHDSNASYLRFLMDREREAFTVVSSGTWTIVMANRGDLRRLIEATRHARQRQRVRRAGSDRALHGWPGIRSDRAER